MNHLELCQNDPPPINPVGMQAPYPQQMQMQPMAPQAAPVININVGAPQYGQPQGYPPAAGYGAPPQPYGQPQGYGARKAAGSAQPLMTRTAGTCERPRIDVPACSPLPRPQAPRRPRATRPTKRLFGARCRNPAGDDDHACSLFLQKSRHSVEGQKAKWRAGAAGFAAAALLRR